MKCNEIDSTGNDHNDMMNYERAAVIKETRNEIYYAVDRIKRG